jgi:hypothetical protein
MHAHAVDGIARLGRTAWDSHFSFGFVRNPWARLVSWYSMISERPPETNRNPLWDYARNNSNNFEEFVTNCTDVVSETLPNGFVYRKGFAINQFDYFCDAGGEICADFIGKFENLEGDFERVSRYLGIPYEALEKRNTTSDKTYTAYYNNNTKQLVGNRFEKDIDYFKYTFEG